jgi:hypothetical protein
MRASPFIITFLIHGWTLKKKELQVEKEHRTTPENSRGARQIFVLGNLSQKSDIIFFPSDKVILFQRTKTLICYKLLEWYHSFWMNIHTIG